MITHLQNVVSIRNKFQNTEITNDSRRAEAFSIYTHIIRRSQKSKALNPNV